jgi:hypothetical protein
MLLIWALTATLVALVAAVLATCFWFKAQRPMPPAAAVTSAPFLSLTEGAVLGNYKWTWMNRPGDESLITLNADHTFTKDGKPNPGHRWEITRDALVIFWLRSQDRLNRMERPGVFVETQDGVDIVRMEKQE